MTGKVRGLDVNVLVVNAGSSSLKLHLLAADDSTLSSICVDDAPLGGRAKRALLHALGDHRRIDAVGHRFVHGGPHVRAATLVDDRVRRRLDEVSSLAPQHMPQALAALDTARQRLPDVPQVACIDTAFHATLPEPAFTYAVPRAWREHYGIRRYGFHGLSYAWAMRRAGELLGRDVETLQLVLAHLGGGGSVCAVRHGRSVATSMGLTPLEGLVMTKRSGTVDPGMVLWLQRRHHLTAGQVAHGLERESGLLGLSDGRSGDTRDLVAAAAEGDQPARLALDVYSYRLRQEIAAAAVSLDRLDALVFTGEIGWDQPEIREATCVGLPILGVRGGLAGNRPDDGPISPPGASVPVLVVQPREDLQIAAVTREALARG
ncbi:MAG: acetate/propionate family kinase [Streptomycetales bacterium]